MGYNAALLNEVGVCMGNECQKNNDFYQSFKPISLYYVFIPIEQQEL